MQYLNLFIQPVHNQVVFPYQNIYLHNIENYNQSIHSQYIGILPYIQDPQQNVETIQHFSQYGTLVYLKERKENPNSSYNAFAFARFRINSFSQISPFVLASVEILIDEPLNQQNELLPMLKDAIKIYMENFSVQKNTLLQYKLEEEDNIHKLFYQITARIQIPFNHKIQLLQIDDQFERVQTLLQFINQRMSQYTTNNELEQKLKKELIQEMQNSGENFLNQTQQSIIPQIQENEPDYQKQYIDSLPWGILLPENLNIEKCKNILDVKHFGLDLPKKRILQFLAIKLLTKSTGSIICLHGPPGVGKTSLGQSIAESLGRPFQKISLGGVSDEAQIRGHRKTYIGAQAGMIIQAIKKAKCINPVILLDEIDKINQHTVGSALLEVLDPEQNSTFMDNYINKEFDLSNVLFIATANYIQEIQPALRDRLEMIEITSYTVDEKERIAQDYIIPKQKELNAVSGNINFSKQIIRFLINNYTNEDGVRELERIINQLFRKIALQQVQGQKQQQYEINEQFIIQILGDSNNKQNNIKLNTIGMCKSLSHRMNIVEIIKMKGNGNFYQQSKDQFIIEQGVTAYSFVRNLLKHISFKDWDIYVANQNCLGVSIAISLISLFLNKKVRSDIAIAGELSLNGSIIKQDYLRQSIIQANENEINLIIIPSQNVIDIHNLDKSIKAKIRLVDQIDEVLQLVFEDGFTYYHYPNL